jgi:hypothetical protein
MHGAVLYQTMTAKRPHIIVALVLVLVSRLVVKPARAIGAARHGPQSNIRSNPTGKRKTGIVNFVIIVHLLSSFTCSQLYTVGWMFGVAASPVGGPGSRVVQDYEYS